MLGWTYALLDKNKSLKIPCSVIFRTKLLRIAKTVLCLWAVMLFPFLSNLIFIRIRASLKPRSFLQKQSWQPSHIVFLVVRCQRMEE